MKKEYYFAIFSKFFLIFTSFLVTIFLNRGLGTDKKGEYAYILNFVEILFVIISFSLGQSYSTATKKYGKDLRTLFVSLAIVHSFISLIIGIIFIIVFRNLYSIAIVILTFISITKTILSMIAVIENSIKRNFIISFYQLMYLIALIILWATNTMTLEIVLFLYGFFDVLLIISFFIFYKFSINFREIFIKKDILKVLYFICILTMFLTLLIELNYKIDIIMLKHMTNSSMVGIYSVGVNLSSIFLLIPDAFKEILFGDSTKKDFRKKNVIKPLIFSVCCSIIIFVIFVIFGKFFINLLYGIDYVDSFKITLILFAGMIPMSFFKILQPIYISHGKQIKAIIFLLISVVANVVANIIFIPLFSNVGAAYSSVVSYSVCGLLFIFDYFIFFKDNKNQMEVSSENDITL